MEKKSKIRVGYVGCGARGQGVLKECLAQMRDVEIPVICDLSRDRMDAANAILASFDRPAAAMTEDWRAVIADPTLDAVFFMNGWYDLCTETGILWYTMNHSNFPKERVYFKGYESGHMIYLDEVNVKMVNDDVRKFVKGLDPTK